MTFDPITLKSIGYIYWSGPTSMSSLRAMGAHIIKLSLRQPFRIQSHCDFDPMTSKSKGSSTGQAQLPCPVWGPWVPVLSSYHFLERGHRNDKKASNSHMSCNRTPCIQVQMYYKQYISPLLV